MLGERIPGSALNVMAAALSRVCGSACSSDSSISWRAMARVTSWLWSSIVPAGADSTIWRVYCLFGTHHGDCGTVDMGLLGRLAARRKTTSVAEVPAERFYHSYTGELACNGAVDAALRAQWAAHYMIYRLFLNEPALRVPTIDVCSGCDAGTKLIAMATSRPVIGFDYSEEAIEFAEAHNKADGVRFERLDLTRDDDLQRVCQLVVDNGVEQAFFVEGIEHLPVDCSDTLIGSLLDAGVKRIRISTPYEPSGKQAEIHHIVPFTPQRFRAFSERWHAHVLPHYLKSVEVEGLSAYIDAGHDERDTLRMYTTADPALAGSYLIGIDQVG